MTQWQNDDDAYGNDGLNDGKYGCEIRILDGNRNTIGWQVHTDCSTASPLTVNSKLENGLVVTPEARSDYVQFTLGSESWKSSDTGEPGCKVGGWDGSDDPMVGSRRFFATLMAMKSELIACNSIAKWIVASAAPGTEANARMDRARKVADS